MFSYKMIMPRTEVKKDTAAPARIIRREKWSNNVLLLRFRLFDRIYAVADRAIKHHRAIIQGEWYIYLKALAVPPVFSNTVAAASAKVIRTKSPNDMLRRAFK